MEQTPESSTVQDDSATPVDPGSLGRTLRETREHLNLSIADVATQTKLAPRQIEALEADDFSQLPEMPFVRGFVRSYAKILQLDPKPLLASMPQPNGDSVHLVPASVEAPFPNAHSPQRQNLIWLGAALLLSVLVVALAVWHFTTPPAKKGVERAETPAPSYAEKPADQVQPEVRAARVVPPVEKKQPFLAPAPVVKPVEEPQEHVLTGTVADVQTEPEMQHVVPLQAALLRLKFDEESWVEIKDKDGKVLSSQVNPSGSELRLDGQTPLTLVIGHAASVRLYYHGKRVDLVPHINAENDVAKLTLE